MVCVRSAALTHPGRKRSNNEDYISYFEPNDENVLGKSGSIYILADGVGGASKGEQASQYAAKKNPLRILQTSRYESRRTSQLNYSPSRQ